jgi:hypothetical protein
MTPEQCMLHVHARCTERLQQQTGIDDWNVLVHLQASATGVMWTITVIHDRLLDADGYKHVYRSNKRLDGLVDRVVRAACLRLIDRQNRKRREYERAITAHLN